jgi:hypothetical protein
MCDYVISITHLIEMKSRRFKKSMKFNGSKKRGGMYRRAFKIFKEVFKGKNPVETADKVKQMADAAAEAAAEAAAKGMSRHTPVTQGKTRTFSPTVSTPLRIETINTPSLNENPYKTPVKRSSQVPLLSKLDRHSRRVTESVLYAPRLGEPSIITGNLFEDE